MEMMERITVGEINKYINVFYGKNRNVWVRGGGPGPEYEDCSLYDFIRRIAPNHGVQVEQENEELDWQMCDMLADGAETKEGLIAFFYAAAIQATEMRERLRMVEEILCGDKNEFDIDRLQKMMDAYRDGRIRIIPKSDIGTCGSCANFRRIEGRRCGTCAVRGAYKNRQGVEIPRKGIFTPSQSRRACKHYEPVEEGDAGPKKVQEDER